MNDESGIKIACPGCDTKLRVQRKDALKRYECNDCQTKFYIPESFGRYELTDIISNDDTTSTHHCIDLETGSKSVLRRLNAEHRHDGALRKVFLEETDKLERLRLDSVVKTAVAGDFNGIPFVVFDHYGETCLKRKLRKGKPSIEEACFMFLDIFGEFEPCFEESLVHGNLKPSNIRYDEHGNVRLLDFGMSAALTKELLKEKNKLKYYNNPYYIAPETVAKGESTPVSDIYSLGAMFYEALTGQKTFEKLTPVEAMEKKQVEKPEPANHLRPGVPPVLNNLIMSMLDNDPAKRPPFIVQIIAILQNICENFDSKPKKMSSVLDKLELDDGYVESKEIPEELLKVITPDESEKSIVTEHAGHILLIVLLTLVIGMLLALYLYGGK